MSGQIHHNYRPDIDGLRAVAVLPVLLFHAGVPGLGGGYVGVDIFFVISGFLITGIIAREIDEQRFSLLKFYERRARRILPALFGVVLFTLAMASWIYLPGDFEGVPRSAIAALLFLANVWFFTQTGYFQSSSDTMPLLHTWSLGVEEQFYIGFPILLMLMAHWPARSRKIAITAMAVISVVWAVMKTSDPDGFAFYMIPTRAWELLAGSILALGMIPAVKNRTAREGLSALGIALIACAVLFYDKATPFPGIAALPPVLGSALLIHCAQHTFIGKALSLRGPVWIGLISYSLYLWHWPLIVFAEYYQDAPLAPLQSAGIIALSVFAAWLSWRGIEQPFRSPKRFDQKRIFAFSGAGMAAIGALALLMAAQGGWSERFNPDTARFAAAKYDYSPVRDQCITHDIGPASERCTFGDGAAPDTVLWGDSHGVELSWALGERLTAQGGTLAQRTRGACPPILAYRSAGEEDCAAHNRVVFDEIVASKAVQQVILAGFWASPAYERVEMAAWLEDTVTRLNAAGKSVVLISAVPPQPFNVPRALARHAAYGGPLPQGISREEYDRRAAWLPRKSLRESGVNIVEPADILFDGDHSLIVEHGEPLYFDAHHLSMAGARKVVAAIQPGKLGMDADQDRDNR